MRIVRMLDVVGVSFGKPPTQIITVSVRIEVHSAQAISNCLESLWRGAERVLIRGQLDGGMAQFALDFFKRLAGRVRSDATRPGRKRFADGRPPHRRKV